MLNLIATNIRHNEMVARPSLYEPIDRYQLFNGR